MEHFDIDRGNLGLASREPNSLERPGNTELAIGLEPGPFLLPACISAVQEAQVPQQLADDEL